MHRIGQKNDLQIAYCFKKKNVFINLMFALVQKKQSVLNYSIDGIQRGQQTLQTVTHAHTHSQPLSLSHTQDFLCSHRFLSASLVVSDLFRSMDSASLSSSSSASHSLFCRRVS